MNKKESKDLFTKTFESLKPAKVRLSSLFQKSRQGTLKLSEKKEVEELKRALDIFTGKIKVCQTIVGFE